MRRRPRCPRLARRGGALCERECGWRERLAETELRPRPRAARSSGSLSGPAIPDSPQAARPAVSERGIGAGGVSGYSAMPGSEETQPARQSSRIQGGQDTVERHDGLSVVMEKIDQWEQENPVSNGRDMIDDFRLRGSRPCRHMGGHLTKEGWRTWWRVPSTTPTLHSQRAKPSPLWSRLYLGIRIGSGLARIPRVLRGKAPCGAGPARPRLARRVVAPHRRGRKWRERPPYFCR